MSGRGCLITFEGIDGAGKSTQVHALHALLTARGHRVVATHEPGATTLGATLRALVVDDAEPLTPDAELFLFLADRAQHLTHVVRPALAAGAIVLCDRFSDSTIAYQGYGRKTDLVRVTHWDAESRRGLDPDLTILLDCPVDVGAARRDPRPDRYQDLDADFHARVRAGFLAIAREAPGRVRVVDATAALDDVVAIVQRLTLAWLDQWLSSGS